MTQSELVAKFKEVVVQVAYLKFSKPQTTPYLIYALPNNDDFHADDKIYFAIQNGWLEMYTATIDFALMQQIENIFIANEIPWQKENEIYLEDEKVFLARWNFQLIPN